MASSFGVIRSPCFDSRRCAHLFPNEVPSDRGIGAHLLNWALPQVLDDETEQGVEHPPREASIAVSLIFQTELELFRSSAVFKAGPQ